MCGITAFAGVNRLSTIDDFVTLMTNSLLHRGPDHASVFISKDKHFGLGHTRLKINDLSSNGNQPMSDPAQTIWLSCNGEIYNHNILRENLIDTGYKFSSKSDSEVIIHLYKKCGIDMLQYLQGMFAFVLLDIKNNILLVARDRLGKKPIVYAKISTGIGIASEIPALYYIPGLKKNINPTALGLYLLRNLRHIPDPWTYYEDIYKLPPGHAMIIKHGKIKKLWKYWSPTFASKYTSPEILLEKFDAAVSIRSKADVEIAALLSGGVDSTAIVDSMQRQGISNIKTYALGKNKEDEELKRARSAAKILHTEHKEFYFNSEQQHENFIELLKIYGEPIMLLPLGFAHELCKQIHADGIRVVMAGHGADELFYGYSGHNPLALLSKILPILPNFIQPLSNILSRYTPQYSKLQEALLIHSTDPGKRKSALYINEANALWPELFTSTTVQNNIKNTINNWLGTWFTNSVPNAYIDEANIIGLMHENCHSVTIAGDLPAMATGVEIRAPFLDHKLVEFAWSIPFQQKVKGILAKNYNKWILKRSLASRLPHSLLYAKKQGFGCHIQEKEIITKFWKNKLDKAFNNLDMFHGILNLDKVRKLKDNFYANQSVPAILIAKLYAAITVASF